ncbi:MAG: ADP-ribose pyrophosphatase, partial [bacterium]
SMSKLGTFFQAYGYANQSVHIFLATDLVEGEQSLTPEEQGLLCNTFTRQEIDSMIHSGEIADLATVGALHVFDRESS